MAVAKKTLKRTNRKTSNVGLWQQIWSKFTRWTVKRRFWQKIFYGLLGLLLLSFGGMYGIAQWYIQKHKNEPIVLGATFVPDYARYFDMDPSQTLTAIINDLGIKNLRLVSYWDNIEKKDGEYDFSELDSEMKIAAENGAKVSLAIGLRQPRWPECHMPEWARQLPTSNWEAKLYKFITEVVNRYKNNPALESYQLENEYFLSVFGECRNFDRNRLIYEYNLVKGLDPNHTLIVSMSNNAIGMPIGQPTPDEWSISVYKRVWDKTVSQRYFEYPIPAWYYAFRAGWIELLRGRNSFIHELQAEPWIADPVGGIKDASIGEQNKSLDATRLKSRIAYGEATGMKEIYLWGVEWWYWRMTAQNDPSLWNVGKEAVQQANAHNQKLKDSGKLKIDLNIIKK